MDVPLAYEVLRRGRLGEWEGPMQMHPEPALVVPLGQLCQVVGVRADEDVATATRP